MADFKISASLKGHEDDVRAVTFVTSRAIASASRDGTVRLWSRTEAAPTKFDDAIAVHNSEFINAIAYISPSPDYQNGLITSGGKDTIIDVRQPGRSPESDAERLLLGHQGNVCALDASPESTAAYLLSGSWDASAKIWNVAKGESTATLEGHEGSVWAVLAYDANTVITGCADKKIRVFSIDGKLLKTIHGSSDVVRALCKLPANLAPAKFASAGNDAIIRLWTLEGTEVAQLHGHENFIYSLGALPSGELVSAGEDRTVRIWKETQCIQTITHPAISVWSVAVDSETGDIATGASDRIVRVFTRSKDRFAEAEVQREFDEAVSSSAIPKQQVGDINKEKLPGPEFLQQRSGTKEGQVQLIKEANGNVSAYQWSKAANQWVSVGTVVDAAGSSGRKQEFMGNDYDYVFDVDIEDGKPALKLPYNLSQNPYEVARKFIADNELPITYLDQVANFIITNTQGANIGQQSESSTSQYASTPTQPATSTPRKTIPQKEYLQISNATFSLITKKTSELNTQLLNDGRKDVAFSPSDINALPSITPQIETALSSSSSQPTTTPELERAVQMARHILTSWPAEKRIPGMDLYRCLAAATPAILASDVLDTLSEADAFGGNANMTMLAIRALANLFAHPEGRSYMLSSLTQAREVVRPYISKTSPAGVNRNVHIAATTLYINFAVGLSASNEANHAADLVQDLVALLQDERVVDAESIYRALVALGTLLSISAADKDVLSSVKDILARQKRTAKEPRIKGVCNEIEAII